MIIKEKRYIKKCDCGTEIIYTRRDCYHNTTWDIYSLYCPSCSREYSYRRGTHHDLFDKEYEEDSVDKDEEIERLNNIIKGLEIRDDVLEEFEDWLERQKTRNSEWDNFVMIDGRLGIPISYLLNKLQELKGEDKK